MRHPANLVYLQAAATLWAVWLASWLVAARWARRSAVRAPRSSFRLHLALVGIGVGALFGEPPRLWHPLWTPGAFAGWALVVLVAAAIAFAWWARIHLGALWSGEIETREGHRIVASGPYGLVRHPIYTGLILAAAATAAIKATPLALLGAALVAVGFARKARVEERFLAAELGSTNYAAYRARVPMLVPFWPIRG